MRRVVVGLFIALIVSAGGYFAFAYWVQHRATHEVDAALDRWRSGVGSATRGRVEFDLWTRTLRVTDVVVQSQATPHGRIAMAEIVASGIDMWGGASRVEIVGLEMSDALPGPHALRLKQKAPRVTLRDYSARPLAPRKVASALEMVRLWIEQFSAITAASIDIPSLTVTVTPAAGLGRPGAPGAVEYTYSNIVLRDVRNGLVAEIAIGGTALTSEAGPQLGVMSGKIGKTSIADADLGAVLAFLDPSGVKHEGYRRVYRQLSVGPWIMRLGDGTAVSIDRLVAEDIGFRPAKWSLDDLIFLAEVTTPAGRIPSPAQLSMLIDKMAGLYEGMHLGKLEMLGLSIAKARDVVKIGSVKVNGLKNGRLAEFAIERLDGQTALGDPVNVGRMALKGFDIANLLRTTTMQFAAIGRPPSPDRLVGMLTLLEGIELADVVVPDPKTRGMMHLETFNASWGEFIGVVPSRARISVKLSKQIGPGDPAPFNMLAARGILTLATSVDVGTRWTEAARVLTLEPATVEIGGVLAASVKASVGNVPRQMFSTDLVRVMKAAMLVEAGSIELSLRDLGGVDLALADLGRTRGGGPEEGRAIVLEALAQNTGALVQTNPGLQPVLEALRRFVQGKREALTITLTPKGRVGVMQLIEAGRGNPAALLASFDVEVKTGR